MPIKGLTDEVSLGFAQAGRVRLGIKKISSKGKEYPANVDHFVMKDAEELISVYGTKPTELLIYLPYKTIDENFPTHMAYFRSGGMYCQGDGEKIIRLIDPDPRSADKVVLKEKITRPYEDILQATGEKIVIDPAQNEFAPCPGMARDMYPRCSDCSSRGILHFMVRDPQSPLELVNRRLVYYTMSTNSPVNLEQMSRSLNTIKAIAENMGVYDEHGIARIPCVLRRKTGKASLPGSPDENGHVNLMSVNQYYVTLEYDAIMQKQASAALVASIRGTLGIEAGDNPALPAPQDSSEWIDADVYDPIEEERLRLHEAIDYLSDMRAEIPSSLTKALILVGGVLDTSYDERTFALALQKKLALPVGTNMLDYYKENAEIAWNTILNGAIYILTGELKETE